MSMDRIGGFIAGLKGIVPSEIPKYGRSAKSFSNPQKAAEYIDQAITGGSNDSAAIIYKGYYVVAYSADGFAQIIDEMIKALPKYAAQARQFVEEYRDNWGIEMSTDEAMKRARVCSLQVEDSENWDHCCVEFIFKDGIFDGHTLIVTGSPRGSEFTAQL